MRILVIGGTGLIANPPAQIPAEKFDYAAEDALLNEWKPQTG